METTPDRFVTPPFASSNAAAKTSVVVHTGGPTYAAVTSADVELINEYVELDTTFFNDCRHLPNVAQIVATIKRTFGEDEERKIIAPSQARHGVYRIETPNLNLYQTTKELCFEGRRLAKVSIRKEKITVEEDGRIRRKQEKGNNDLLITLVGADRFPLNQITQDDLLREVTNLGIGNLKRAPQRQYDKEKAGFSGNKYFILEEVLPADRNKIPKEFSFEVPGIGRLSMQLNHRFKMRHCTFCGNWHDAVCEVREKYNKMREEKNAMKAEKDFTLKICGDSTVRYFNGVAIQGEVEAMSGATTGNVINSLEVDDEESEQIVFVTGSNEKKATLDTEEYLYTLKIIKERVEALSKEKKVAMVPPPTSSGLLSAEEKVREEVYVQHLQELKESGVKVWQNPLEHYDEDWGAHPSPQQSAILCNYIHKKVESEFGVPALMKSATEDIIALPNKYAHVTSFYKYGCGACGSKERNKWFNICDLCKKAAKQDPAVVEKAKSFQKRLKEVEDEENPELPSASSDSDEVELKCDTCDVFFSEVTELREHISEAHPGTELKLKRTKNNDGKSGRRVKTAPEKSLPNGQ
jgi:hypothetical protein